jgi:hypothetical protein
VISRRLMTAPLDTVGAEAVCAAISGELVPPRACVSSGILGSVSGSMNGLAGDDNLWSSAYWAGVGDGAGWCMWPGIDVFVTHELSPGR